MRKIYLDVPFKDKDKVKNLGAKWDSKQKKWFITEENSIKDFKDYFSEDTIIKNVKENELKTATEICRELGINRNSFFDYLASNNFIDKDSFVTEKGKKNGIVDSILNNGNHKLLFKNTVKNLFDENKKDSLWKSAIFDERKRIIIKKIKKQIPLEEISNSLELKKDFVSSLIKIFLDKGFISKEDISYLGEDF